MEPRVERFLRMILLLKFCCLWSVQGLSVVFSNPEPVFVVRGQTLILQAQIELLHTERLSKVTWERETKDSGKSSVLAEFPLRATEGRVKLENQGATLRMVDFQSEDEGVYAVTVIEANGKRRALHTSVQEYVSVGHVSVLVNVSHHVLHCLESWGTEPSFSWLHEKVPVEEHEGRSSPDRSTLHVSGRFCGSFTCVVSNRLGHSSATYSAEPCDASNRGTTTTVVLLIILLTLAAFLAFTLWRKEKRGVRARQRLREPYEEHL